MSAGRAPSWLVIPWHLPYNRGKSTLGTSLSKLSQCSDYATVRTPEESNLDTQHFITGTGADKVSINWVLVDPSRG